MNENLQSDLVYLLFLVVTLLFLWVLYYVSKHVRWGAMHARWAAGNRLSHSQRFGGNDGDQSDQSNPGSNGENALGNGNRASDGTSNDDVNPHANSNGETRRDGGVWGSIGRSFNRQSPSVQGIELREAV
jgi:hypothetical protein